MQSDDRFDMMALFVKVADTGRLVEASRQLGLSQPAASRMLRRLERILNVELIRRSTHGLRLTAAGQRFADIARAMLEQWQRTEESFGEDASNLVGSLRILVPVALGQNLIPSILASFCRIHPGISIDCDLRDDSVDLSLHGYDLQVRAGPILHQSMIARELWEIQRTIVAGPGHAEVRHPADLARFPAVRLRTFVPQSIEMTHVDGESVLLKQHSVFTSDNLYAILAAVREGLGYAILPVWATQRDIEAGALRHLCLAWRPPTVAMSLVYPANSIRSKRLEALLAFLRHELTAETGRGSAFLDERGARPFVKIASTPMRRSA